MLAVERPRRRAAAGERALALPASPAATAKRTVWAPALTGTTCQAKVRVVSAFSGPSAHVLTYAVCPPPGGLMA